MSLPFRRHAVLCVVALPLTYLMYCSLPRALRASPTEKYTALNVFRGFATLHFRLPAKMTEWDVLVQFICRCRFID